MAYTFNGATILAPLSITSNQPIYETDTVSLSKQRASQGAQRWEISFTTVTTQNTEADMLVGMIQGLTTSATMVMPQLPSVANNNTIGVSSALTAAAAAGESSVIAYSDGVLSKGSFIKFSNHDKLYMVTADVTAGASVVVNIYPSLRTAVTTSHTLETGTSAVLSYYRDIDTTQGLTFSDGIISSAGKISLVEAI